MRNWRITDRLPAIRCPVLVLQGDRDEQDRRRRWMPSQLE